jgi:DNA-binding IclR family transcriptional regulator
VVDVMAIAAPLRDERAALGIAVAGPLHRMESAEKSYAARLLHTVRQIGENARG